jgi:phosphopantothenoylcysteine decarboxylase/phosphopantothenate--cysteine ligase
MEAPCLPLNNKQILLGITGGIAAYKAAELLRLLQKAGAQVRVIMTRSATEFITPLTLQALSGRPVHLDLLDTEAEAGMGHIELARWADSVIVAPASADFLARLAQGRADDLLTTVCLASTAPILVAPAMNQQMWINPATGENISILKNRGITVLGPDAGEQACGEIGPGRMLEATQLADHICHSFQSGLLQGKRVIITAGPTREPLDPVRYLSNNSSGKMGYALARAAVEAGASVTLISGPTALSVPGKLQLVSVLTAMEMHKAAMKAAENCDIFIAAAAVADYRPATVAEQKIKKGHGETTSLELVKNPDIVATVARQWPDIFVVGFAAETQNLSEHARNKLQHKHLDMIVVNDVSNNEIGFHSEQNAFTAIWSEGEKHFPQASKTLLAQQLVALIAEHLK